MTEQEKETKRAPAAGTLTKSIRRRVCANMAAPIVRLGKSKQPTFCVILQVTQTYVYIFNEKAGIARLVTYTRYLFTLRNI